MFNKNKVTTALKKWFSILILSWFNDQRQKASTKKSVTTGQRRYYAPSSP